MEPGDFDAELVRRQLRYTGMLHTVRIRRAGYPIRMSTTSSSSRTTGPSPRPARSPRRADRRACSRAPTARRARPAAEQRAHLPAPAARDALEQRLHYRLSQAAVRIQAAWSDTRPGRRISGSGVRSSSCRPHGAATSAGRAPRRCARGRTRRGTSSAGTSASTISPRGGARAERARRERDEAGGGQDRRRCAPAHRLPG